MEEALLIRERDYFFNLFFTQFLSPISLLVGECFVLNPLSWINLVGYLRAQSLYTSMKGTFRSFRIPHCLVSVHRIHLRVLFMYTGYAVIGFFRFFFFFFSCALYLMSESIELGNRLSGSEILILTLQNSDDMLHSIFIILISDSPNQTPLSLHFFAQKSGKEKRKNGFLRTPWWLEFILSDQKYILHSILFGWLGNKYDYFTLFRCKIY